MHATVSVRELVTALKMRFPGDIHLQALPETAENVKFEVSGGSLNVTYTRRGDAKEGS